MVRAEERGFTLIELAIVLTIIGLVVGGILVGQNLIANSQMISLMKQVEKYKTAVMTFRDKYAALPGDIANATMFWPADPACAAGGGRAYMTTPNGMTCNGNGNGIIAGYEPYLFWQHLSLAGLIQDGPFTGTIASASWGLNQTNSPTYPIHPGTGVIEMLNPDIQYAGQTNWFVQQGGQHVFWLGAWSSTDGSGNPIWTSWPYPALTHDELKALDTKYDDGSPATGTITGGYAEIFGAGTTISGNYCYNASVSPPVYYPASNSGTLQCSPMFKAGF